MSLHQRRSFGEVQVETKATNMTTETHRKLELASDAGKRDSGGRERSIEETLDGVRKALEGLHYGSIEITVHDGWVVQIERKERIRFGTGNGKS